MTSDPKEAGVAHDREVGGIRCLEVLDHLADLLDGRLDAATREQIEAHLRDCNWCERFGGAYASTVADIRKLLADPEPLDEAVQERLSRRLREALEVHR